MPLTLSLNSSGVFGGLLSVVSLCKVVISFTTNPSSLCYDAEVRLFCFSSLDSSSLSLSLISGLFLLSPAMMAPHLAVGTMRNDKMGEPCFYLMGQNQTTVCSQVCPSSPSPLKNFLSILSTPSAHPHLNSTFCICPWVCLLLVCMLPVLSCLNRRYAQRS